MGFLALPLQVMTLLGVIIYTPYIFYKAIVATSEFITDFGSLVVALIAWTPLLLAMWFVYDMMAYSQGWPRFP